MKTIVFTLFFSVVSNASIDTSLQKTLSWGKHAGVAATMSDYTKLLMTFGPFGYAATTKRPWQALGYTAAAHGAVSALTLVTKFITGRVRPDGKDTNSFFSGHTSAAATGAGLMCLQTSRLCVPSIALAALTGYLRVAGDRHFPSDVLVGFGVGFAGGYYIPTLMVSF